MSASKTPSKKMPKVLVTDNIHPSAADILKDGCDVVFEKKLSHEELLSKIAEFDALMIRSASTVSADVLEKGKNLKIVGRAGVGTDNIDLENATAKGVVVVNSPEGNTVAAAEHTIAMLMALSRHIPEADQTTKAGEWARSKLTGVEVFGKTLGVVGLGKIGSRVAKACLAMGMKVNVYDPYLSQAHAEDLGVTPVSLDAIWEKSDFITIHAPKTRETMHLINRNTLARCKKGVRLVNCARGAIVDEQALAEAVESGHVAGIALDVFEAEPIDPNSPLLKLGNKAILTPHLGASTEEAQVNVALDVAEQIRDFFAFGHARNAVNIPTLSKDILDPVKHYMPMAEVLGSLVRQLAEGAVQSVEITAKGDLSEHKISPVTLAVLKGVLSQAREGVNFVNALLVAKENGIQVKESSVKTSENYLNVLEVVLNTDKRSFRVAGTLISDEIFRIVDVDGYPATLEPTNHVLFTPHHDRPGMIAKVATTLGGNGVNISALQVARRGAAAGGESMMIFNLDNPLSDDVLGDIRAQEGIYDALYIRL